MDKVDKEFLTTQNLQPLLWLRYIDDIFFIWKYGERATKKSLTIILTIINLICNLHMNILKVKLTF